MQFRYKIKFHKNFDICFSVISILHENDCDTQSAAQNTNTENEYVKYFNCFSFNGQLVSTIISNHNLTHLDMSQQNPRVINQTRILLF